jgi:hypothetical protein
MAMAARTPTKEVAFFQNTVERLGAFGQPRHLSAHKEFLELGGRREAHVPRRVHAAVAWAKEKAPA